MNYSFRPFASIKRRAVVAVYNMLVPIEAAIDLLEELIFGLGSSWRHALERRRRRLEKLRSNDAT